MNPVCLFVVITTCWLCTIHLTVAGEPEEQCGVLAAISSDGKPLIFVATDMAQGFQVLNTSRITSITTSFMGFANNTQLGHLAVHSPDGGLVGPALPNGTFDVASVWFAPGRNDRRVFNATRPEGILLPPGRYYIVLGLLNNVGWITRRITAPPQGRPGAPVVISGLALMGPEWQPTEDLMAVLDINGCVEASSPSPSASPTASAQHGGGDSDAGEITGIVLGVGAAVTIISAAGLGLLWWIRRQRGVVAYQTISQGDELLEDHTTL